MSCRSWPLNLLLADFPSRRPALLSNRCNTYADDAPRPSAPNVHRPLRSPGRARVPAMLQACCAQSLRSVALAAFRRSLETGASTIWKGRAGGPAGRRCLCPICSSSRDSAGREGLRGRPNSWARVFPIAWPSPSPGSTDLRKPIAAHSGSIPLKERVRNCNSFGPTLSIGASA